jgi:RNA polymerase primary sigma factor
MVDSLRKEIERSLATLTEREADVLRMFFGIGFAHPFSLEEIGDKHSLTRERVRQIKEKAVKRLQHNTRSKLLKTYLG